MNDYITIVILAKSSKDPLYSQWAEAEFSKIEFINSDPSSSQFKPSIAQKSKIKQSSDHCSQPSRQRIIVNEVDAVFVPGLSSSIDTLASNSQTFDRKSKYFVTLGTNGILDMTDTAAVQKYEELLLLNENGHRKSLQRSLQRSLHRIKYSHIPDQNDVVRDVYQHILKVHNYSPEAFSEKTQNFLSEQDYIIKVLGLSY
ncbi:hypothetical protein HMPREF1544_06773 [Mucor circinelloides 1006PhL]|uniref:Uncharacterized protein n=1 Tax=Mucor circinelloides f. circinelloides (strain 1006PhL) TaxID=1220926 RepID=S2J8I0_MUCC1|nr:hypothetical protein HMPREF1544_06773 [Mucor circinelloides 1006PhL]